MLAFCKCVFSDRDGKPSFSRIATAFLIGFAIRWVSLIVQQTHALPDFGGLTLFIGAIFALDKAKDVAAIAKGGDCKPEGPK